jgi:hypothetical protein
VKAKQCTQCDYKTFRQNTLANHIKSVHEHVRYHCDHCCYSTTRTNYLKHHINFVHGTNEKNH